jgi:hypothetical protein
MAIHVLEFGRLMMRFASVLSAAVVALAAGPATAQEMIDNGEFTAWSKYKKGASTTLKTTSTFNGMTSEATMTTTLVELGDDKVVVEYAVVSKVDGKEFKAPAEKRDVPKRIALPKGAPKPDPTATKPPGTYEEGTETIKVGGTELKTKWYKYRVEVDGTKTETQMWVCEEVPGQLVRMESKATGSATIETKAELVEFKKP